MGSWTIYCEVSNIAIKEGDDMVILPIKKSNNSYSPYIAATLPIFCTYNDYGNVKDIEIDTNTKIIEDHFKISINEFTDYLLEGKHTHMRDEYILVKDKLDKLGTLKEMVNWNFMFIDRKVYDKVIKIIPSEIRPINFTSLPLLKALGFDDNLVCQDKQFEIKGDYLIYNKESIYTMDGKYNSLSDVIKINPKFLDSDYYSLWKYNLEDLEMFSILDYRVDPMKNFLLKHPELRGEYDIEKPKNLIDKYVDEEIGIEHIRNNVRDLNYLSLNLYSMSKRLNPYTLYSTPQCGNHSTHLKIVKIFKEILEEKVNKEDY